MKFLLNYTNSDHAKRHDFPLAGTEVEISTIEDLLALQTQMDHNKLIIHQPTYAPHWVEYLDLDTPMECQEEHRVFTLPVDHQKYSWIEVYNGWRE